MKKLLIALAVLPLSSALAGGYGGPAPTSAAPAPIAIGGQTDDYGCLSSAGLTWSVLKKGCLQPWNAADIRLDAPGGAGQAAYILFSKDGQQAELLGQQILLKRAGDAFQSENGLIRLFKEGQLWNLNMNNAAPVGGQEDEHGCLGAAGATWSALRGECVQVFDAADIRLDDPKHAGLGIFVLLSSDQSRAELFGADYENGVMLQRTPRGYASADGKVQLDQTSQGWILK